MTGFDVRGGNTVWPLLDPYDPEAAVFWSRQGAITAGRMLARAADLAQRLPARPLAANYCGKRDRFAVALLALWMRGHTAVFPADRSERSYRLLAGETSELYCLIDEIDEALPFTGATRVAVGDDHALPAEDAAPAAVAADHPAVKVFTSGSTGKPSINEKTWGMLVAGGKSIPPMIDLDRFEQPSVVATVPGQHMYGFELSIMNVLQGGASAHVERPIYPADIARCLEEVPPPRVLTTTPVHLRALVESAVALPVVEQIVSATAPLSAKLAAAAEERIGAPVWEIYGFTEAGSVAGRRTTETRDWRLRADFRACDGGGGDGGGDDGGGRQYVEWSAFDRRIPFPDVVELLDSNMVRLHGRAQDIVNIAGKRASLAGLSALLQEIDGVEDGAVWLPAEDEGVGKVARLAAFVVAPGGSAEAIRREFRKRTDPAFAPRQVVLVDSLGRNATGKLTQEALQRLAARHLGPIRRETVLAFPADHPCLEGHFPGHPLVPAAAILAALTAWVEAELGRPVVGVKSARFRAALLPEANWSVTMESGGDRDASVTCSSDGEVRMSAKLVLGKLVPGKLVPGKLVPGKLVPGRG